MKYVRGFLMAWGMFCWIPCPYKKWREEDRLAQIGMFPLIGTCIGAIICACWWLLQYIGAGAFVTGCLLSGLYFLLTGFIHLDGFMDCSDAVMPRHPEMAERRRILKDSHVGAFAVICLALMLIVFTGSMIQIADSFSLKHCILIVLIFTASRFMSAIEVILDAPMDTSQYAYEAGAEKSPGTFKNTVPAFIIMIIVLLAAELIMSGGAWWSLIAELYSNIVFVVVVVAEMIVAKSDIRKLGGMSGDISGHMITIGEMLGMLALALIV